MVRVKDTIRLRLEKMVDRYEEIGRSLADPAVIGRQREFRELSVEYSRLTPVAEKFDAFLALEREFASARDMQTDSDPGMREMGAEEVERLVPEIERAEEALKMLLIPRDPRDDKNIYLEVRAGTGGDEAAIFAGDLFRMYARYAETHGFTVEMLSESPGEHGGYREIISRIVGRGAFARFKFESGTHRVQRVPATEAQGRIHTSACTVAILPKPDEVESIRPQPGRPAHRHLPRLRRRRPARQQDRLRHPHHAPADRPRGRMPGRALAAQEPLARDGADEGASCSPPSRRSVTARSRGTASCRWAPAIAPSASAPTTFRRVASPITASTSRSTSSPTS